MTMVGRLIVTLVSPFLIVADLVDNRLGEENDADRSHHLGLHPSTHDQAILEGSLQACVVVRQFWPWTEYVDPYTYMYFYKNEVTGSLVKEIPDEPDNNSATRFFSRNIDIIGLADDGPMDGAGGDGGVSAEPSAWSFAFGSLIDSVGTGTSSTMMDALFTRENIFRDELCKRRTNGKTGYHNFFSDAGRTVFLPSASSTTEIRCCFHIHTTEGTSDSENSADNSTLQSVDNDTSGEQGQGLDQGDGDGDEVTDAITQVFAEVEEALCSESRMRLLFDKDAASADGVIRDGYLMFQWLRELLLQARRKDKLLTEMTLHEPSLKLKQEEREWKRRELLKIYAHRSSRLLFSPHTIDEPIGVFLNFTALTQKQHQLALDEEEARVYRNHLVIHRLQRFAKKKAAHAYNHRLRLEEVRGYVDVVETAAAEEGEETSWWSWSSWLGNEVHCSHILEAFMQMQALLPT
eukprot:gene10381-21654_t